MILKDIMTRDIEVVHPNANIQEAADKMDALNVGPLPVCDGDRLVGIITDRDIVVRATAAALDPRVATVRDAMTDNVIYAFEDQDVREAARLMEDKQIRRLVVLNRDKRLVGIVSLGDIATATGDDRQTGEIVERVSAPSEPNR